MAMVNRFSARVNRRVAVRGAGVAGLGAALGWRADATLAQDATPVAGGACGGDPAAGDTVAVVGPEGSEIAQVTVTDVVDPFEAYNPNSGPTAGHRFVVAQVRFEVTGPRPMRVEPSTLFVQDTEGFVYRPTSISLPDDTTETPFEGADVESGASAEGLIAFSVIRSAEIVRLFHQPGSDRLLLLADLRG